MIYLIQTSEARQDGCQIQVEITHRGKRDNRESKDYV
jgi:hypothetical protein